MLTEQDKALLIYRLVKRQVQISQQGVIATEMKLSAEQTGQRLWSEDPDNAFGRSPYNVPFAEERTKTAREEADRWNSVLDHAVETFIQGRK